MNFKDETYKDSGVRYRRLFETARDGLLIIDADTEHITDINPFLVDTRGYRRKDFIGKPLWRFVPFKNIRANRAAFKDLIRDGFIRYQHLPLQARDGRSIEVEFISSVHLVEGQRKIQCIVLDHSKSRLTENLLLQNRQQIEQVHQTVAIESSGVKSLSGGQ